MISLITLWCCHHVYRFPKFRGNSGWWSFKVGWGGVGAAWSKYRVRSAVRGRRRRGEWESRDSRWLWRKTIVGGRRKETKRGKTVVGYFSVCKNSGTWWYDMWQKYWSKTTICKKKTRKERKSCWLWVRDTITFGVKAIWPWEILSALMAVKDENWPWKLLWNSEVEKKLDN